MLGEREMSGGAGGEDGGKIAVGMQCMREEQINVQLKYYDFKIMN